MSCLEKIIGIIKPCDTTQEESISGYYVTDYPGITLQAAANSADEKYLTGYNYIVDLRRRAMLRLNNDIISYINANYRVNGFSSSVWNSGEYGTQAEAQGTEGQFRGDVIYKQNPKCKLYKIVIPRIRVYSNETIDTTMIVKDTAGKVYNIPVSLEEGVIKEFTVNLKIEGAEAHILLPSNISVYRNKPNCGVGCQNTKKSECVRSMGVNNGTTNDTEAYGIEADVLCQCDLSTIACDLAMNSLIGQCAFELIGGMFYDEQIKNNRLNYLTIYKGEELKQQAAASFDAYRMYFENAMKGIRQYIVNSDGGCKCVDCSGVQFKANI
jgi:hypothetical protein